MQSGRAQPRGTSAGNTPLRLGLIKHLRNRCSRQDVVELLEQQHRPVVCLRRLSSQSRQQIGLPQQSLQGAVVAFLIRAGGGAAAMQFQVKLIPPDG